ncbi:hypothetical protein ODR35_28530, partial [Escherichia coli]|nr:hypothetical protein [Escherichia coli]
QKQKKLIMLPSETMIWQPEFTDKTLSRKPGAVQSDAEIVVSVTVTQSVVYVTTHAVTGRGKIQVSGFEAQWNNNRR